MRIADHDLAKRVLIVAEIGNNHEGDYGRAEEMVARAADAGADAVKFQTIVPERLVSPRESQRLAQLRKFQLSYDQFVSLSEVAKRYKVLFLSTPFDLDSVASLNEFVPAFKIASGDNDFVPLLEAVAATGKPIILSTGLLDLYGIGHAKAAIEGIWAARDLKSELALLHCVSAYPVPPAEANLAAITALKGFGCTVGYSDHTIGNDAAVLSVALGARIIEKHFTLDNNLSDFRDHKLSANPVQLADLVARVRMAEVLLGSGNKAPASSEVLHMDLVRRSIVAACDLEPGTMVRHEHLMWLRPRTGIEPGREGELIGRRIVVPIAKGDPILPEHVA